jgi:sterol desaturase/sphingolipid hydroxylase (fatty acid hydroxylase superfamily)
MKRKILANPLAYFLGLIGAILLVQSYYPFIFLTNLLNVIDSYLRLILTSWPAVVLILGFLLICLHFDGLHELMKKIKSATFFKTNHRPCADSENKNYDHYQKP